MTRYSDSLKACVAIAALFVAACAVSPNGPEQAFDINARFPVTVQPRMMTLRLPYNGQSTLDQNMTGQLTRFAQDYLEHGNGAMAVSAPRRYPMAPNLVADQLLELGLARNQILVGNDDAPDAPDDIKITYIRYVADTPPCGDWSASLTSTVRNTLPPNFGCATQHNMAAMVADPRDLLAPESGGQPDARRRLTVLDKYRRGDSTPATRTPAQSGTVSQVSAGM